MEENYMDVSLAADTLAGATEIAEFIGKTVRQTQHLLETKQLPAFKLGGRWHMRQSKCVARIEQLEAGSIEVAE
jgi:hypothetical protein